MIRRLIDLLVGDDWKRVLDQVLTAYDEAAAEPELEEVAA